MKKIIFALMLLIPILNGCNNNDDELMNLLEEMKVQNEMMRQEIRALQDRTESLINSLNQSEQNTAAISGQLTALQTELASIMAELERLNAEMQSNNANVADIQVQISALNDRFAEIGVELENLQKIQEILNSIDELRNTVTSLEERADAIFESTDQTNNELAEIRRIIAEVRAELDMAFGEIARLTLGLAQSEVDVDTALQSLTFLENQVRNLTALLNQLLRSI